MTQEQETALVPRYQLEQYHYAPLQPGQIRLIQLEPGRGDSPLRCKLVPHNLEDRWIPYTALSYCWGDSTLSQILYCPQTLPITTSLYSALRRLRHEFLNILVWADAVCINQTNIQERNEQLLCMQRIYQQAGRVATWLGEEAEDSHLVLLIKDEAEGASPQLRSTLQQAERAFNALLRRPWFTRVWVIQEVALATAAEVLCGSWVLSFRDMADIFKKLADAAVYDDGERLWPVGALSIEATQYDMMEELHNQLKTNQQVDLLSLLARVTGSMATNSVDYLYGVLGLASHQEQASLPPDYGEGLEATLTRFATYFVQRGDGLRMLGYAHYTSWREGVPTWVPGWAKHGDIRHLEIWGPPVWKKAWSDKGYGVVCSYLQGTLETKFRSAGNVQTLGPDFRQRLADGAMESEESARALCSSLQEVAEKLAIHASQSPPDETNLRWVDANTLSLSSASRGIRSTPVSLHESLEYSDVIAILKRMNHLRLGLSSQGYLCQVPYGTQVGDELMSFDDDAFEPMHFVCRRYGEYYKVVGPCHATNEGGSFIMSELDSIKLI